MTGAHAGKAERPPARHQQQPRADRAVEAGKAQIGAGDGGGERVDPVSGRIGDASGAVAHFCPSGVPVRVSKVPRPVLMLLESVTGAPSASLKVGCRAAGAPPCAATWQTLLRSSIALPWPTLIWATIFCGMPHPLALSVAYLRNLASAAVKALNRPQASFGVAWRSLGGLQGFAFFLGVVAQAPEFLQAGRGLLRRRLLLAEGRERARLLWAGRPG